MQIPLNKLRFDPDPLGLNAECDCPECRMNRVRRDVAKQLGVSEASIVGLKVFPLGNGLANVEASIFAGPTPAEVAQHTPAPSPLITPFDTNRDGTPRKPRDSQPVENYATVYSSSVQPREIPAWMVGVAWFFAVALAGIHTAGVAFGRFIKGKPQLRVVRQESA